MSRRNGSRAAAVQLVCEMCYCKGRLPQLGVPLKHLFAGFLFCLAACAGGPEVVVTDGQLAQLVSGKTAMAEAETLLGAPTERRSAAASPQLVYGWTAKRTNSTTMVVGAGVNAATIEIERREVVLTFAPEGTLKDIERFTRTTRSGHMSGPAPQ